MRRSPDVPTQRTYQFRLTGLVYLAVTGFLAVAAISSQNNLLFWSLGLAVGGIAVSGVISGLGLMGVRAERVSIPEGAVGERMVVRYRVSNNNWLAPAFGLMIYEREPGRRRRVAMPWQRCLTRPVAFIACVRPGQQVEAEAGPVAVHRGRPECTDFVVASAFPFGLAVKSLRFNQRRTSLVFPRAAQIDPRVVEPAGDGAGRSGLQRMGGDESGDFYGIREYVPGDSMRSVAWSASARLGQMVVRQHVRPTPTRLWVRLELAGTSGEEETEELVSLAAGAVKAGIERGFAVGLLCPDSDAPVLPTTGRTGLRQAFARLAMVQPSKGRTRPEDAPTPGPRDTVVTVRPDGVSTPAQGRVITPRRMVTTRPGARTA